MFKYFIHIFVLSCEKATYLIEKQLHDELGFIDKFQLKIHMSICKLCKASGDKSKFIDDIISSRIKNIEDAKCNFKTEEIDEFKSTIKNNIYRVK